MAYTVLARKYRSQSFSEVIGQAPIATTLVNAIKAGRIHHGYLFTGTRGVGKTSMARILAKALNCLKADGPTPTPCCQCDACIAIAEGQDIDVVEIDAASNTGVDNIRELRSNAAYRPARSRFKVYIIDEVHMLSTGAFNALLKTLEEPPGHVKFILATTEIQKVPATIQSRCQRFTFRNIGPQEVAQRLDSICRSEGAEAEPAVLQRVARLANGSMRDALSILDQLLSVSATRLTAAVLDEILPPAQDEQVVALLTRAAESDASGVLAAAEAILSAGRGLDVFCQDMIECARTLLVLRACGPQANFVDVPAASRESMLALAGRFELSHSVQMIGALEELRRNVRFSASGRALVDAVLVRLARLTSWGSIEQLVARLPAGDETQRGAALVEKKKPAVTEPPAAPSRPDTATPVAALAPDIRTTPSEAIAAPRSFLEAPAPAPAPAAPALSGAPQIRTAPADEAAHNPSDWDASAVDADEADLASSDAVSPPQLSSARPGVVTAELRARVLRDGMVQQALELFSGLIVNIQAGAPAGPRAEEQDD